jgi:predicted alpha/beta superfamily hydrolase
VIDVTWEEPEQIALLEARRHVLAVDDEQWEVTVALPDESRYGSRPLKVLYLLDPSGTVPTAAATARTTLRLGEQALCPVALVGVGPHSDDTERLSTQRIRDLTPTPGLPRWLVDRAAYGAGGADRFLSVIADVVAPHVDGLYGFDSGERCIGGWSLGGMFACYASITRPDAFTKCLAVSPSLYWDDQVVTRLAGGLADGSLRGTSMYLGTAEHDGIRSAAWPPIPQERLQDDPDVDMVGHARAFADAARRAGASVVQESIADEHHVTVWAAGVTRGLVSLYRTDRAG